MILVFALVFFARATLGPYGRTAGAGFLLSTVTLWMPYHANLLPAVRAFQLVTWPIIAWLIVKLSRVETSWRTLSTPLDDGAQEMLSR